MKENKYDDEMRRPMMLLISVKKDLTIYKIDDIIYGNLTKKQKNIENSVYRKWEGVVILYGRFFSIIGNNRRGKASKKAL